MINSRHVVLRRSMVGAMVVLLSACNAPPLLSDKSVLLGPGGAGGAGSADMVANADTTRNASNTVADTANDITSTVQNGQVSQRIAATSAGPTVIGPGGAGSSPSSAINAARAKKLSATPVSTGPVSTGAVVASTRPVKATADAAQKSATETLNEAAKVASLKATANPADALDEIVDEAAQADAQTAKRESGIKRPALGSNLRRRFNKMFGGSSEAAYVGSVATPVEKIVGNWNVDEEDGLRRCAIALDSDDNSNMARATPGCSDALSKATSWGMFGEDLLLRDVNHSVLVRLRQSGNNWLGFTVASGIPVSLGR